MNEQGYKKIRMYKLTGWYKKMSKMKYKDNQLRLTIKGLESLRNALENYRIKNKWNQEYTEFLKELETEILMLLCKNKWEDLK